MLKQFENMKFTPSLYQEKIFEFITKETGNAVINAKAGSGKTTTLVEAMKLIPHKERVLFVAFNKSIEEELRLRLKGYDNVDIRTYHGLGYSILRTSLGKNANIRINEHKYSSFINNSIFSLIHNCFKLSKDNIRAVKTNLKQLVDFSRFNLAESCEEIKEISEKYGIVPISNEIDVVPSILEWGKNNTTEIDYTDMIWLCVERNIRTRKYKYDYIFIDEAQDSSIMQQELIKKCHKRGTRFIAIGDEFQCINAFAGADQDAFKKLQNESNTKILNLPITYRCPKSIVDFTKKVTGVNMETPDNAINGEINFNVNPYTPKNNDMVLCRNTAHLVKLYMKYNRINKKSYLKGRNIGESLKTVLWQVDNNYLSQDMMTDGVFPRLYERLFDMINKEIAISGIDYEDVVNTRNIMDFIDTIKALEVLSEGLVWRDDLISKIETIFTDNDKEGICLSTIHKAKGLESDNVFILCPSLMPSKFAKKEWEKVSEENLIYVAMTRAKKTLNYISEDLFPANLFGENENVISDLEYQRKRMNHALKINSKALTVSGMARNEQITHDVRKLMNVSNSKTRVVNENKRKKIGGNKMSKYLK